MTNVLKMVFTNTSGSKSTTWNLTDPKEGVTQSQVVAVMNTCIDKAIPLVNNYPDNVMIKDAYIYQTEKVELA